MGGVSSRTPALMRVVAIYHIFYMRSTTISTQSIPPILDVRTGNGAFELSLYSFAELPPDPATGTMASPAQRLHNLIETIELADQVGWMFSDWVSITALISFLLRQWSS